MKCYIGIDLGGTNIAGALVREDGEILKKNSVRTLADRGPEAVSGSIAELILSLAEGREISGVGVGCPGSVDDEAGDVVFACNLNWVHYDLRKVLREKTGFCVRLVNDANAATLAEALAGTAKGAESAVIVTLGTGVGSGVVLGGKLLTGYTGAASELGHSVIVANGEPCACGRRGCFEQYASATALTRMTKKAMAAHPESKLHAIAAEQGKVSGRTAFLAKKAGDPVGAEVVREYIGYLALGLGNIINAFFPEIIALSGGIAKEGEYLLEPLRKEVEKQEYAFSYSKKHTRIECCSLGNDAGVIGAALFSKE